MLSLACLTVHGATKFRRPLSGEPKINAWYDSNKTAGVNKRYDGRVIPNSVIVDPGWYPGGFNYYYDQHNGVDFNVGEGTAVYAAATGVVITTQTGCAVGATSCGGSYGNNIKIKHGDGRVSIYAHLKSLKTGIAVGSSVACGSIIGYSGNTGLSDGPHLHFEIWSDSTISQRLDPFAGYWNSVVYRWDPILYYYGIVNPYAPYPSTTCQ